MKNIINGCCVLELDSMDDLVKLSSSEEYTILGYDLSVRYSFEKTGRFDATHYIKAYVKKNKKGR